MAEDHSALLAAPRTRISAQVRRLWERFHSKAVDEEELVDPYELKLVGGWKRCEQLGVDPGLRRTTVLPDREIDRISQDNALLLDKARQPLERVPQVLRGVPGTILLADAAGTILHVATCPSERLRDADTSHFTPGAQFSEAIAGTNGIAAAIAQRMPVRIHASEHYCERWHQWSCTASPILDPFTGEVLGVIDFSVLAGYESDLEPLTSSLAEKIREDLRVQIGMERIRLIEEHKSFTSRFPADQILSYDRMGRLVRSTLDRARGPQTRQLPAEIPSHWDRHHVFAPHQEAPIGTVLVAPRAAAPAP